MTRTRVALFVIAAAVAAPRADANPFWSRGKGKSDSQVRALVTTLRTDPDDKRRRNALSELKDADPRTQADVIPALVGALQRDPVAQVRADAAEVIGSYRVVFPLAGSALEAAAETDPAAAVRDVAKLALWEYHLLGYRSSRGADGFHGQTAEPPVAARPLPRPVVLGPPSPAVVVPVRVELPPVRPVAPPPASVSVQRPVLPILDATGPRVVFSTAPPLRLNLTGEPPFARK